jgi:DNA-binding PadR family transcriptional regulator
MAVKYAVLGLLLERCGYGYDLMQRLEERLGPAWQLNPSTVYAALDQLEVDELIEGRKDAPLATGDRSGRRARRVVYEITERGRAAFEQWIGRPSERQEPVRSELQLRIAAARDEDMPALLNAVNHAELLTRMLYEECQKAGGEPLGPYGGAEAADGRIAELVPNAAIFRLEGELRWLEAVRSALDGRSRPDGRERLPTHQTTG